jgi:hypothetical protein
MQTTNLNIMCTLYFDPGTPEFRMVEVLHDLLGVKLADARDAVDLHRVKCPKDRREEFIKTIEKHGGKVI